MGGKLFDLGRMPRAQYLALELELRDYLQPRFGDHFRIPRYYGQKPDFGDMDIILSEAGLKESWNETKRQIADDLNIEQSKVVGSIFSTVYKGLQVDFFHRSEQFFLSTYQFLCWNDLGNLLGKMFRRFNLKYGEEGLQYVYRRTDGHYQKDILITLDIDKILAFLQLDVPQWHIGFDTLDDIYRWVIASPYFSVLPYLGDDDKAIQRRIRQERTTVQRFVEFLQRERVDKQYPYLENRDEYLPMIADFFREEVDLLGEIEREQVRERQVEALRRKWNGDLLMQWFPALSGKSLGAFIQYSKQQWQSESDFEQWLQAAHPEEIQAKMQALYLDFTKNAYF